MTKNKKRNTPLFARLKNYFITGIVVLVPIGITLYLTKFFISISSNLIPKESIFYVFDGISSIQSSG